MKKYNHQQIEKKWQKYWEEHQTFKTPENPKNKQYVLDMIPYVSAAGLHVGHPEGYTATDILSRYLRMNGFDVLHPMGWDAFGLPAENFAIKTGVHPEITTQKSIKRFREQIKAIGLSYDWEREVDTSNPDYYKWTQWLFLLFYKNGLAYKKEASVNWCPKDNTVLANEQVVNGACERCGTKVVQKMLSQWFFKITDYAERLLDGLDQVDWPEPIRAMQRNWIGKSQGVAWKQKIKDLNIEVESYDSVPQTFMAQTFCVIAPEHPLVKKLVEGTEYEQPVLEFIEELQKRRREDRFKIETEIEGVFTGRYIENPFGTGDLPIWIASFVLADYGTGIVNASAHDERDFAFAKKFGIPLRPVMFPADPTEAEKVKNLEYAYHHDPEAVMQQPVEFKGRKWGEAREDIIDFIEKKGFGYRTSNYKLRDWLVSRQRYWGAPIPIIYCDKCGMQPVPEADLPVVLPKDVDFLPTGESPLTRSKAFHNVKCPKCGAPAKRDSDTMDTFVDSSWYFYRYVDPNNGEEFADKKKMATWLPVDTYVGGAEHAVLHLLYSRFFAKVLFDLKFIKFEEPFLKLRNQGLILGPDGEKMSKSRGNVINPDDIIAEFGADSLRMYEMFLGPLEDAKPWNTQGLIGLKRFLERVWFWVNDNKDKPVADSATVATGLNKLIKKVTTDITAFHFNTAISSFMQTHNEIKNEPVSRDSLMLFLRLLYPFAPHISEEMNEILGGSESLQLANWPEYDAAKVTAETVQVIVQVNGKMKDKLLVPPDATEDELKQQALASEKVKAALAGVEPTRIVVVPGRLVNIVV